MKKRILALLLVLCLTLALLAGCAKSEPAATEPAAETQTEPAQEAAPAPEEAPAPEAAPAQEEAPAPEEGPEPEADPAENPEPETASEDVAGIPGEALNYLLPADTDLYPLCDEQETLTVYSYFQNQSGLVNAYEEYPVWAVLEEATGVHLEWNTVSPDAYSTQFQLFIAGGDFTDLFYKFNYTGGNAQAYEDEVIIPLDDVITDYMPNYAHAIQWNPAIITRLTDVDGCIYQVAPIIEYEALAGGWTIRQDFLDKVGMEAPTTIAELEDVLVAFQSQLGMNSSVMINQETYADAFATTFDVTSGFFVKDGEYKYGEAEEGFRESVELMNRWYGLNLFDHDFLSITSNPRDPFTANLIASGDTGVFKTESRMWDQYLSQSPEAYYTALPAILRDENSVNHFKDVKSPIGNGGTVISTACEDVELAARYLDYMFSRDGAITVCYGVEGKSYFINDEGKPQFDADFLYGFMEEKGLTSTDAVGQQYWYPMNDWLSFRLYIPASESWIKQSDMLLNAIAAWNDNSRYSEDNYTAPTLNLTSEANEEVQKIQTDLETYISENLAKFVVGEQDIATQWEPFVRRMYDDFDLARLLEIYQEAYDASLAE